MQTISRYIMTLVALLALTTQAWADYYVSGNGSGNWCNGEAWNIVDGLKMTESNGIYSITFANVAVPEEESVYQFKIVLNNWDDAFGATSAVNDNIKLNRTLQGTSVNNMQVEVENITFTITATSDVTISFNPTDKTFMISTTGMKVGDDITVEPVEGKTNEWTFIQPGSDVVLTPIYAAATIYQNDGETEKQAYETLKEAFANVQDGDVIKLDWDVKLTEMVTTPSTASGISFTLDFNGHTIDGSAGTNYINIDNGCELTLTDNTATQMGGLKCHYPIAGSNGGKVIFQGGRYSFNGCSSSEIALEWDGLVSNYGWVMGDGKEFVDLNNGNLDDDGFPIRVDWKAIELTIGAGKFATFYMDQNITLADGTDANIGLYTINGEGINLDNNTVTVTKVNDPIAIAGMPLLVYNGTTEQKTVTLRVTPVAPTAGQMWSLHFQGTAVDKTFDATDMAANDYYVLSGGKAFAPVRGTGTIGKNKCWLEFAKNNGSAPARQLTIVFDNDDATGVNEVIEVNEVSDDTLYDLNGRKLQGKPTKKGVYIMNGQKKVVK